MQKLNFTATLAAIGLFAAGQAALATPLSPEPQTPPPVTLAAQHGGGGHAGGFGGGHMGGFGGGGMRGGFGGGHMGGFGGGGMRAGPSMRGGPMRGGFPRNFGAGRGPIVHGGRAFAGRHFDHHHHHHHHRRFFGPFIGFGYDYGYDYPYYDSGSCYWNCRNSGYGPGYCRVYAYNFCY